MIVKAKHRLTHYSPESFAHGLQQAYMAAISKPKIPTLFQILVASIVLKVKS